jgi:putative ABC transport system permease protein
MTIAAHDVDEPAWAKVRATAQELLPGVALVGGSVPVDAQGRSMQLALGGECRGEECARRTLDTMPVGDERLLALLQGREDPRAAAALAAGKAVAFDPGLVRDGMVELRAVHWNSEEPPVSWRVPAVVAHGADAAQSGVLVPPAALAPAGLKAAERALHAAHVPADEMGLATDLRVLSGGWAGVTVERRWDEGLSTRLLMLVGAALVLVLGGTFAATGLAAADMRQDLDTLSAVGAALRVRRLVVAGQAAYISGLGALVGLAGGVLSGVALTWPLTRIGSWGPGEAFYDPGPTLIDVPWLFLAGVAIGLPALAALLVGLLVGTVTRTRPTPVRRVA